MEVQTMGPELCAAGGCQARNVLGVLPGRDAAYADQVVILGAHYDHLGQTPDGTVWAGANDNASGVAVLLEIARTWHEQGYVPRHTVLFAAWDAEEEGLLGSIHYVQHPRYPLEDTAAMIQLDMVGAGGDTLWIDGGGVAGGELSERLQSAAEALGVGTELTDFGRSDHVPFLRSGVPAGLLIWCFDDARTTCNNMGSPQYHRPQDTAAIIEPDKLEAVGQIVGITLLGLTEGEPAIHSLLEQRAVAVEQGDLAAFLGSSVPEQEAVDRLWFDAAQALAPAEVEMRASDVRIQGRAAAARVHITLRSSPGVVDGEGWAQTGTLAARFEYNGEGWRWAGPDLVWEEEEDGFAVAYPRGAGRGDRLESLGQFAADAYADMATRLGLPTTPDAAILVFPDAESLRTSTAPSLSSNRDVWVGPAVVKLAYTQEISSSQKLADALAQLLLAEAGVVEGAAPWLWQGLPLAFRAEADLVGTHTAILPGLHSALTGRTVPINAETSWAAVDYLQERLGWEGLGKFIAALGQACRDDLCDPADGSQTALELALSEALELGVADALSASEAFERAWQEQWRERLAGVKADLDAVLAKRVTAVLAGDEESFLSTVDWGVPGLLSEEQIWFDDLIEHSPEEFSLTGIPEALFDDGSVLARVTLEAHGQATGESAGGQGAFRGTQNVMLTREIGGYRWAGVPYERLRGGAVDLLFPKGRDELAQAMLLESESIYEGLAAELGVDEPDPLIIKLYDDEQAFQASIPLSLQASKRPATWSSEEGSVKLHLSQDAASDGHRPALAVHAARHLLRQMGVDSEWLLKGVSTYLSRRFDGGVAEQAAALHLKPVLEAIDARPEEGALYDLAAMPPDHELSGEELGMARAQAWDSVRYLAYAHGWEALVDLMHAQAQGQKIDSALQATIDQTRLEFEAAWAESLTRAHAQPEWIDLANAFDPEGTNKHIAYLASPELAGRAAGSPGADAAAEYIASTFAEIGLVAAGEGRSPQRTTVSSEPGQEESAFFQTVPLSRTVLLSAPRLEFVDGDGQIIEPFIYRQEFLLAADAEGLSVASGGAVTGELVWVDPARADGYHRGELDLTGKVVILHPASSSSVEVAQAVEQGATGLIVVGDKVRSKDLLAKAPLASESFPGPGVPVLELTQSGYERLLAMTGHLGASGAGQGMLSTLPVQPLNLKAHLDVPLSPPQLVETANVLGLLPGSDPVLSQEVVIVGAHYDHVGDDPATLACTGEAADSGVGGGVGRVPDTVCEEVPGRRYDGANDDASGVGVLLEIARLWKEKGYRPKRSVLFAAWGAQEGGEVGSAFYVEHPTFPLEETVAMLQLDAVGGGRGYYLEAQGGGDREALLQFNLIAAEEWVDGRLAFKRDWTRSDQVPFRDAGIPSLLLTWRDSSEENWPVEIADEVQPYRLGVTGRMVTLALMALAQ
jgi:Zn-dependent M28 family amino/carboxypeptidase